jgi:NADH-quinone oxidoreductase subunit M
MIKRVVFGAVANDHVAELKDVNPREFGILLLMAAAVLAMGLYPKVFTDITAESVNALLEHVAHSKLR